MKKIHLGQCRGAGVTGEHEENAFGSMQRCLGGLIVLGHYNFPKAATKTVLLKRQ
ncbi:hypothetical protein [Neobacillus vireti]|uniref:hypothetical protein n=1 Tax=Neobacillus vireti TaxID=220686 RepID=UPI002FFED05A